MTYSPEKYEALIQEWKKARPEYKCFCLDGIIDDNEWKKSPTKIMFLLKESYGDFCEIRNNKFLSGNIVLKGKMFWRKMRMWTYIIDKALNGKIPTFDEADKIKNELNKSIAYVNLKKHVEQGRTKSNYYDIRKHARQDKDFLLRQIEMINPQVILCSGTFDFCSELYGNLAKVSEGLYKYENRFFIKFWHLSCPRKSYEGDYNALVKIAKKMA